VVMLKSRWGAAPVMALGDDRQGGAVTSQRPDRLMQQLRRKRPLLLSLTGSILLAHTRFDLV
jgi:hypothetical protein